MGKQGISNGESAATGTGGPAGPGDDPPPIDSRESFISALQWGFRRAIDDKARLITCVAPSFEAWPLDDPELLRALAAWLRLPLRRLLLLAAGYETVPQCLPRFTAWRRDWAHALQTLQAPPELAADLPTLLLDDRQLSVHLIDDQHWRGRASVAPRTRLLWQERIDVVLQRAEPAFAVTTLGL